MLKILSYDNCRIMWNEIAYLIVCHVLLDLMTDEMVVFSYALCKSEVQDQKATSNVDTHRGTFPAQQATVDIP